MYWQEKNTTTEGKSQERGNGSMSRSNSSKALAVRQEALSLSPALQSFHGKIASKTEGHPNAIKNIKNLPILYSSFKTHTTATQDEGPRLTFNSKSLSNLDFRYLDTDQMAKLFAPGRET